VRILVIDSQDSVAIVYRYDPRAWAIANANGIADPSFAHVGQCCGPGRSS
jgi:hypothetical protein